ncbi:cholinesterase-like isoform X2 [Ornithodoros turicata]|uniref:cholinesterase-like isoform X2 n=1 Tax=Ornithodoros turicata TaxID=34597 RepID=UPI0031394D4C
MEQPPVLAGDPRSTAAPASDPEAETAGSPALPASVGNHVKEPYNDDDGVLPVAVDNVGVDEATDLASHQYPKRAALKKELKKHRKKRKGKIGSVDIAVGSSEPMTTAWLPAPTEQPVSAGKEQPISPVQASAVPPHGVLPDQPKTENAGDTGHRGPETRHESIPSSPQQAPAVGHSATGAPVDMNHLMPQRRPEPIQSSCLNALPPGQPVVGAPGDISHIVPATKPGIVPSQPVEVPRFSAPPIDAERTKKAKQKEHEEVRRREKELREALPDDLGRKQSRKKRAKAWFHAFFKREVVVKAALGLTATISVTATILSLVWMRDNIVDVTVRNFGVVRGTTFDVGGHKVYAFLGLYYAKSPEGQNRFKRPVAIEKPSKIVDATKGRPGCSQGPFYLSKHTTDHKSTTENCLHLNIWAPCVVKSEEHCLKTVVVFLHGTAFQDGDNNRYDGRFFSMLGDVILVIPNFRLGAFAFVSDKGVPDAPGNLALYDQQLAIEWVLNYIQSFGGNNSDVVIMASGSGAWSLGAHLLSNNPFWRTRFSRIIMQGETPFTRQFTGDVRGLATLVKCSRTEASEMIACMRRASARDIVLHSNIMNPFGPTTDDELLTDAPVRLATSRVIQDKELLIGCTSDEGSSIIAHLSHVFNATTTHGIQTALDYLFNLLGISNRDALFKVYTNGSGKYANWAHAMVSDVLYVCPLVSFANHLASKGNRVFGYMFDYKASFSYDLAAPRSPHLQDVDFIMGVPLQDDFDATDKERALSRAMIRMWSNFIKKLPAVDNAPWPSYTSIGRRHVRITLDDFRIIENLHRQECLEIQEFLTELKDFEEATNDMLH